MTKAERIDDARMREVLRAQEGYREALVIYRHWENKLHVLQWRFGTVAYATIARRYPASSVAAKCEFAAIRVDNARDRLDVAIAN